MNWLNVLLLCKTYQSNLYCLESLYYGALLWLVTRDIISSHSAANKTLVPVKQLSDFEICSDSLHLPNQSDCSNQTKPEVSVEKRFHFSLKNYNTPRV